MPRSTRRGRPRPSIVVTFAASASLLACGGSVDASSPGPSNDGGAETNPASCPATAPSYGSPCEGSLSCDYKTCYETETNRYECQDGKWTETLGGSCNPPAPACPPTRPTIGSACLPGTYCTYPDDCADRPPTSGGYDGLSCNAGKWTLATTYVPKCPATTPVDGAPCMCGLHAYGTCSYPASCVGSSDTIATCSASSEAWSVPHSSCNPPAPDSGPFDVGSGETGVGDAGSAEASSGEVGPGH